MPSAGDIFNELKGANQRLDNILAAEQAVRDAVVSIDLDMDTLISVETFATNALVHQIKQNDTIICLLRQIADQTCRSLNEAHTQTGLQKEIAADVDTLADLYSATHADVALTREREEALRRQIEACCPPASPPAACQPTDCPDPGPFDGPIYEGRPEGGGGSRKKS